MKRFLIIFLLWCSPCLAGVKTDGATQYLVATGVNLGLNAGAEMSACGWISIDGAHGSQLLINKLSATNEFSTFRLQPNSGAGNIAFSVQNQALNGFPNWATSNGPVTTAGAGRHLVCFTWKAAAFDATDGNLYLDGTLQASVTFTANNYASGFSLEENSNDLSLGARTYSPVDNFFNGTFGGVAIWSKQLTAGEITTLYNGGFSRPCSRIPLTVESANLVFYAPLDDQPSGTVSTTPVQLGTASASLAATGSPIWTNTLNCMNAKINGAKLNGPKLNGGTFP